MGQKKSFTDSTGGIFVRAKITPNKGESRDSGEDSQDLRQTGRPRNRRTSTSQQGLRDGLTRMTFIVSQEHQDKLKFIAYNERLSIREILAEAIEDYLNKYEQVVGPIQLN